MSDLIIQQKEQKDPYLKEVPIVEQGKGTENGTGFGERLKQLIGNRSGRAFAKEVNISYSTLHNYLTNTSLPTLDNLITLATYSGVSIEWLATGYDGQKNNNMNQQVDTDSLQDDSLIVDSFESINVSAGFGSFNAGITQPDGKEPYSKRLLDSLGIKASNAGVFWANGDSMEPTIADGDQMLVDLSCKQLRGNNKVYLVQNGDSVWVKRVKKTWEGIELISDNKEEYDPIFIPANEAENLQIIGQVVHIGHSFE